MSRAIYHYTGAWLRFLIARPISSIPGVIEAYADAPEHRALLWIVSNAYERPHWYSYSPNQPEDREVPF